MRSGHAERRKKRNWEREAEATRRKYRTWEDVLAEGTLIQCGKCGQTQFVKGILAEKTCRKCGARLVEVGV